MLEATPKLHGPQIDRAMTAELRFPSGATGTVACSMWSKTLLRLHAGAVGDRGEMRVFNPTTPKLYHRLKVTVDGKSRVEHLPRVSTYERQLAAFRAAVVDGGADAHAAVRLHRQHPRHRRDLPRRGHEGARHVGVLSRSRRGSRGRRRP